MSLEKIDCPICKNQMTQLRGVKYQVELLIDDPEIPKLNQPASFYVCKKCHNIQTFLHWKESEFEPI